MFIVPDKNAKGDQGETVSEKEEGSRKALGKTGVCRVHNTYTRLFFVSA